MRILVTGAAGLVGRHLVRRLKADGHFVIAADYNRPDADIGADLLFVGQAGNCGDFETCVAMSHSADQIYHLAAAVGKNARESAINATMATNMLHAASGARIMYVSSDSVYNTDLQTTIDALPLRECDAWPARPANQVGLSELFIEGLFDAFKQDYRLDTKVVRLFPVYGPGGLSWTNLVPATCFRLVKDWAIEVDGDGKQVRSFLYVADAVDGLIRLMNTEFDGPVNLGHPDIVSVQSVVEKLACISGKSPAITYRTDKTGGVRGRRPYISRVRELTGWEPATLLTDGLTQTFEWMDEKIKSSLQTTYTGSDNESAENRTNSYPSSRLARRTSAGKQADKLAD